jgi:hypothetical protein
MDVITSLASTMQQLSIQQDVGVAMLSKTMDSQEAAGQGVQRMINSVPTPGLGGSIDIRL